MKYAIISDVHANESALRHVLADAAGLGVERVICLGDVVGYGPLPKEALTLVRKSCAVVLAGNHDDAVSGRQGADDFIDLAGDAVKRHRKALSAEELNWLKRLPYDCAIDGALAAHGDFTDPPAFNYIDSEAAAAENFRAVDAQLTFVGHTHLPGIYLIGHSGTVYRLAAQDFTLEDGKRYIVNPGSVGYPRENDGMCLSSYVVYDSTARAVNFRFLPFAVSSVMQRGANPRRRIGIAVAIALGVLAVGAALFRPRQPSVERETVVEVVQASEDPALVLSRKQLTLARSMSCVQANLQLDGKSEPADLLIEFKSALGESLLRKSFTVSKSARQPVKIPSGAVSAHFTVLRQKPDGRPSIRSFAPSAK